MQGDVQGPPVPAKKVRGRPFVKGDPRAGRPKGRSNALSHTFRDDLLAAHQSKEMGGLLGLIEWGVENRTEFYRICARLVPLEVLAPTGGETPLFLLPPGTHVIVNQTLNQLLVQQKAPHAVSGPVSDGESRADTADRGSESGVGGAGGAGMGG